MYISDVKIPAFSVARLIVVAFVLPPMECWFKVFYARHACSGTKHNRISLNLPGIATPVLGGGVHSRSTGHIGGSPSF